MRVLFVCTTGGSGRRQLGGAERFLVEMLPALADAGVVVVAGTPDDEVGAALRTSGTEWHELGARRRVDPGYVRGIRRLYRAVRPDVVSAHLLSAAMHCRTALAVAGRRAPLVVTLHNSLWQYRAAAASRRGRAAVQANIALDLALRRLRPHASVAVSGFEAAELRDRGRVRDVRVIANPLPAHWPATAAPTRGPGGPPVAGFLGRLEPEKGADLLADLARAAPEVRFRVAGTGSVAMPDLPNLELVGRVDAGKFLRELDCLVVPSRVEAFGRSAVEAMSLGVPVVHTGAGGLAEVTARGAGILAFAAEPVPAALAAAVRAAVATGPARRAERLVTARWYRREYAFPRAVERWLALFRSVSRGDR